MGTLIDKATGVKFSVSSFQEHLDENWGRTLLLSGEFPVSFDKPLDSREFELEIVGATYKFSGVMISMNHDIGQSVVAVSSDVETDLH